jgi:hypothetical protein
MNTEDRLEEAIEDGEVLKIIYHGGSQPGASRYIPSIKVESGKVRARCYPSNEVKSFHLNKLTIINENENRKIKPWNLRLKGFPNYKFISDLIDKEMIILTSLWRHIVNDEVTFSCKVNLRISIHRRAMMLMYG